jgi:hypothetical protein
MDMKPTQDGASAASLMPGLSPMSAAQHAAISAATAAYSAFPASYQSAAADFSSYQSAAAYGYGMDPRNFGSELTFV